MIILGYVVPDSIPEDDDFASSILKLYMNCKGEGGGRPR